MRRGILMDHVFPLEVAPCVMVLDTFLGRTFRVLLASCLVLGVALKVSCGDDAVIIEEAAGWGLLLVAS